MGRRPRWWPPSIKSTECGGACCSLPEDHHAQGRRAQPEAGLRDGAVQAQTEMCRDDFMIHIIATSDPKRADAAAVRAGKAFGAKAGQYDYIGKTHISLVGMQKKGGIPTFPTFDRFVRTSKPPPDQSFTVSGKYYTSFVDEVKPLGLVVCTHDALELDRIVDIVERHAIDERNRNPGFLHQGCGGKGAAIMKRPKSQVMLCIYGARFKPQAFREKHKALHDRKSQNLQGAVQRRARQLTEATTANSSVADAFRGFLAWRALPRPWGLTPSRP